MTSTTKGNGHNGGYEERDVVFRPVVGAGLALLVIVVFSFFAMQWLFEHLAAREATRSEPNPLASRYARELPPLPRLQAEPIEDLISLREAEDAVLLRYGWLDRDRGVVRLPIERALQILAEQGLPARSNAAEGEG
jgi:hypothetical protein